MIRITIEIDEKQNIALNGKKLSFEPELKGKTPTPIDKKPIKSTKAKRGTLTVKEKICAKCGKPFKPAGNAQKLCSIECGMKPKSDKEKQKLDKKIHLAKPLSPEQEKELDQTLREIEERKNQPYQFM